ncbi:ABC transporter ATP-binding protein [Bosea vaviloviae]|uniref:High-affinity branched-chain amino acid ABC transporter ATP-binding protein LivG n=1 Tax=Bosea vaviloviae TaxID=1526658 RepID=A0A1D7UC25_9HYPH|nr:ABC transporter ATP-binding protein [Bosea vaviloviae]AOO84920.1 high-affinity branched-chain amino acid ABC transporter ATP-binding protein LivG [Bosea vaviloviae]
MNILRAHDVSIAFGGVKALNEVGFDAIPGEVLAIIGPNGAGKTTLFNVVSGLYRPSSGHVELNGRDINGLPPHRLAGMGLSRTFQNLQVFTEMSLLDNVLVGRHLQERHSFLGDLLRLPSVARQYDASKSRAAELVRRVGLEAQTSAMAGTLPYGALRRLEIARALATEPKVLMLDEPAAGCNPAETRELGALIRSLADDGRAVVLVEHDMRLVMSISDRIVVLDRGRVIAKGAPADIRSNAAVIEAYLGRLGAEEAARA